jgi:hypothetical protein
VNELLIPAIIASLKITFIHVVFNWEGMLLDRQGRQLEHALPTLLHKPLFSCHICMASIWGIIFWFLDVQHGTFRQFVEFILLVGGLNVLISCFTGPKQIENET